MRILERQEFLARANAARSDYDYGMVDYKGMRTKVIVKCKTCRQRGRLYPRQVLLGQKIDCECVTSRRGRHRDNHRR